MDASGVSETPGRSGLGAFVITYRRPDAAVSHVEALLRQTLAPARILVLDNDDDPVLAERVKQLRPGIVEYRAMGANLGPAGAAAYGLHELAPEFEWVYWGDDDQPPETDDQVERLIDAAVRADAASAAMRGWRWSWERAELLRVPDAERAGSDPVSIDATGGGMGLILRGDVVASVGLPKPEFFWGYEDIEYVLRLRRHGLRVVVAPGFWDSSSTATVAGTKVASTPVERSFVPRTALRRTYFTVRNSLYMVLYLHRRPVAALWLIARAMGSALRCFRQGPSYGFEAVRQTVLGLAAGLCGRLGGSSLSQ